MTEQRAPRRAHRVAAALAIGVACAFQTHNFLRVGPEIPDFFYWWSAARMLLAGVNPYLAMPAFDATRPPPYDAPFAYPLPAVLAAVPLAGFEMHTGAVIFGGVIGAVFAYCVTAREWWRLLMCLSVPFVVAVCDGQWSPLIVAAALVPQLAPLLMLKPTLGLASLAYARSWKALAVGAVIAAATLIVIPQWPLQWVQTAARMEEHPAPIATQYGLLLLLALLRWRRREAWTLLVMSCVPQLLFFYDQLPLWLIPRTPREMMALTLVSALGLIGYLHTTPPGQVWVRTGAPWVMATIYLPTLIILLLQPNEGTVPAWLEGWLARLRLPAWLRGRPQPASAETAA